MEGVGLQVKSHTKRRKQPAKHSAKGSVCHQFPSVIWQEIARFSISSLKQWISLSRVNTTLHRALQHPRVLAHCKIYLMNPLHVPKLSVGVHHLSMCFTPLMGAALESTPNLFGRLTNLQYLDLSSTNITTLQHLPALPSLRTLVLRQCSALRSLSALPRWPSLTHLDVQQSTAAWDSLGIILTMPKLAWLSFNRCHLVDGDMDQSVPCHTLTSLDLSFAELTNTGLNHLAMLPNLDMLILSHVYDITHVGALGSLTKLRTLYLDGCASLVDISSLVCLHALQLLNLYKCVGVTDLTPLSGLLSLQSLVFGHSPIHDLTPLSSLHQLRSLGLSGCKYVSQLDAVEGLPLEYLDITDCQPSLRTQALSRGNAKAKNGSQKNSIFTFVRT